MDTREHLINKIRMLYRNQMSDGRKYDAELSKYCGIIFSDLAYGKTYEQMSTEDLILVSRIIISGFK